jgi:adenine-specific DNA-methyltransferase
MARVPGKKNKAARPKKRAIDRYEHTGKKRINNPPVGLVTPETDRDAANKIYIYDPHIDPALQWAGKAEHTSFEIPTLSLHVHERIDPRSIIEAVRKKNGDDFVVENLSPSLRTAG